MRRGPENPGSSPTVNRGVYLVVLPVVDWPPLPARVESITSLEGECGGRVQGLSNRRLLDSGLMPVVAGLAGL